MAHLTHDRGAIIDFVGRLSGSPALKADGSPTVVTGHDAGDAKRVGWAAFFKALEARHLALRYEDDLSWSFVDRHAKADAPSAPPAPAH